MQNITLHDGTYSKLQALAEPLTDTVDSVIVRLLEHWTRHAHMTASSPHQKAQRDADAPIYLTSDAKERHLRHVKLLRATVGGDALPDRPTWLDLLKHMACLAQSRLGSYDAVRRASNANLRPGRYEERGFHYLPAADMSIQGGSAYSMYMHANEFAKATNTPVAVHFQWHDRREASHPGRVGTIGWSPNNT